MEDIKDKNQPFEQALARFREAHRNFHAIHYASSILYWDSVTGAPKSGVEARSMAMATISGLAHQFLINEQMDQDLKILDADKELLTETERVQVRETRKEYDQIAKIPIDEFRKYNALITQSQIAWEQCKEDSDFLTFQPFMQEIIDTFLRFAHYRGFDGHPYNLYIGDTEFGMDVKQLDVFFAALRTRIVPLLKRITERNQSINTDFLHRKYPVELQKELSVEILDRIGFDRSKGWFKESVHPFTIGIDMEDVRLTTRYSEEDFLSGLSSTIHEGGHGIYEQNVDTALRGTGLASGTSNGIHESQSRIYENNFLKSKAFCEYLFSVLKDRFPEQFRDVDVEMFYRGINHVKPSLIRVDADELTYSLHVMIRYEIELGLIDGSIQVKDLPEIWNAKMQAYLGITPPDNAHGVLQDVHWSAGLFGYFPSYALGSAYAAQIEHIMRQEMDVDAYLKQGDFKPMTQWLSRKIHQFGCLKTPAEIILEVTGEPLNPQYYCDYLEKKYTDIYDL